jgi:hypothetical protein
VPSPKNNGKGAKQSGILGFFSRLPISVGVRTNINPNITLGGKKPAPAPAPAPNKQNVKSLVRHYNQLAA